ncbi:tRNA synthetase class I catalytic domain-containing protein [Microdochium trichocladiopsis]|uniref:cysteine--tRNA ligase n=1 Tax=Microdochium trichocladiopsis TaxID=1682393 RepID=A0A9P9BRZ5_9PEZI|nr:tRNA synthetase class I catalytic domain-containing protein [Microdochium trichocladiopsis]KAH7033461.1 tRNA synthetase class I catalytic domain-containing protein [Microdochium trichocladiopsis]
MRVVAAFARQLLILPHRPVRRPFPVWRNTRFSHSFAMDSIRVHNSLKPGGPVPFVPIEKGKVSWYACGPTVYDQSHLGHARNYVSTDIIRRILMHYFGFDVKFVMNFTDVDDKIILRARRNRLLEVEKKKQYSKDEIAKLGSDAFQAYAKSSLPLLLSDESILDASNYNARRDAAYGKVLAGGTLSGEGKPGDDEAKLKMHISNMDAAAAAISSGQVFGGADEILLPYLDSLYKESVDTSDQSMFTDLTRFMEGEFTDDMDNLNVLRPDVVVRVTEYVPQIAKFVETIVDKGFAYEAEGSVYFDIAAFEQSPGNKYARLRPESRNDKSLQEEGEGSLSKSLGGKRSPGDFALWKKSKAGEPYWPSKWGNGRPGWHIECSVMASDVLGGQMDLHSGGIDLAFPHHDNELAQSEAFYCEGHEHTWVNYFLHMGHLSISGSKMSKSLKNFQTIKDALANTYTARSMRIVFLLGRWNDGVEISPDMRLQADGWESTVNNFFTNVKSLLIEASGSADTSSGDVNKLSLNGDKPQDALLVELEQAKKDMDLAMANSFDTPAAMRVISELIRKTNVHIKDNAAALDLSSVEAVARWVTKIVGILGLDANARPPYDGLGWASSAAAADVDPATAVQPYKTVYETVFANAQKLDLPSSDVLKDLLAQNPTQDFDSIVASGTRDPEQLGLPYVRAVSKLRDELRKATASASPDVKKAILALSDRIRDYDLTNLGVYLDDRPDGQPSLIKFVPAAELIAARDEKAAKDAEKARAKEEARLAREKAEAERWEKAKLAPEDMFKSDDRYSEWDGEGMPTKMKDGSEVPKSQLKKLKKDWDRQKKAHTEWKTKFGSSA